jgi:hypothetical protein
MSEYEYEPIRGLPVELPADEKILWQGSPRWQSLAVHLCHVRSITLYFAVLMAWRVVVTVSDGRPASDALETIAWLAALLGVVVAFLGVFAFLAARTTIYTITTRRVVLRYGIAFTKAVNVPLRIVQSASLRTHADGSGDLPLALSGPDKIAYLILWPHVRPWRIKSPQPMLRAVGEPKAVAEILASALAGMLKADVNGAVSRGSAVREPKDLGFGNNATAAA